MPLSFEILIGILCLTFSLGTKSLIQHAVAVGNALKQSDKEWQTNTNNALIKSSKRLSDLLLSGGTALFQWLTHPTAKEIYEICAKPGILIRYYDDHSIHFGLPGNDE